MTDVAIAAPADEAGVIVTADPSAQISDNDALGAVWDKHERDNGATRSTNGRFASTGGAETTETPPSSGDGGPLEGGEGAGTEGVADASPPAAVTVPLPATFTGLDEQWSKIPPEAQAIIAEKQAKLHTTLSDQGRFISTFRPVGEVFNEFKEYFGGERGNYSPPDAVRYLFGLQRGMDEKPMETLLQIADTYELRPKLAELFGANAATTATNGQATDNNQALLVEINELKRTITGLSDPSKIDQRINQKFDEERTISSVDALISRLATKEAMPLYTDVEAELPDYIDKAWAKLGDAASQDAVFQRAYDMAVNADPDLRAKAAALKSAAVTDPKLVADARRANETNIRSTSTGKQRDPTEDELLGSIWDKHKR